MVPLPETRALWRPLSWGSVADAASVYEALACAVLFEC